MTASASHRWIICHIDLSQGLPELPQPTQAQGLYLVLWWHHIPLGHLELLAGQLPLTAAQWLPLALPMITATVGSGLRQQGFEAPLPEVKRVTPLPFCTDLLAMNLPLHRLLSQTQAVAAAAQATVSVVICTRDRPQSLARCLRSLQGLITPAHEIIVIDNAPTSEASQQLVEQFPGVLYCREPRPGLSVARNRGIAIATGEIIAFTDDDVEVHPHWLEQLRTAFHNPRVMAMTGLILPARLETEAEEVFQRGSSGFGWGYRPLIFDSFFFEKLKPYGVPVWRIGAGANMAFRREVFNQLGGFDERLGAGASGCSEDSEYWYRVLAAGWTCRYQPTAVVSHYHRADFTSLSQQMTAYMRGHVAALLVQMGRHRHWGNLYRLFICLPKHYAKQITFGFLHGFRGKYLTVFTEMGGCLSGIVYYLRHRSDPISTPKVPQIQAQTSQVSASSH
ncbi:glycosyltransferase family 2 protein [Leptolyngbya sp. KIOST-1]|uniref:glycosyltransferase family 2 protein n=1 Tax=Leptolyngbya sp. KIOST-1 TaxID=1229172 RepID=UPI000907908A|nr:glycosyltransferase [Leptolyngbya sp. KIOST-1]